jgi:tetratricopeptide (TPR) repeat protein
MLPAVFVLLRLFVWPVDLSPDYHPLAIERLEQPTLIGAFGLAVLVAVIALALLLWRRHRAASLGLLLIGLAWLPTSNLFFPSGIVLAERTLYLPSVGLALLVALGADAIIRRAGARRAALLLAAAAVPLVARTMTRIPDWRSTRDLVVTALIAHPESYKVHQSAARVYLKLGLLREGLTEYGVAAEIYPLDHYLLAEIGGAMLGAGDLRRAHRYLAQAEQLDSNFTPTQQLLAQAYLREGSPAVALGHARRAVRSGPGKSEPARMLAASYVALGMPDSALAVWPAFLARGGSRFDRWLLGSVTLATIGQRPAALTALDSATAHLPRDSMALQRLERARAEVVRVGGSRP